MMKRCLILVGSLLLVSPLTPLHAKAETAEASPNSAYEELAQAIVSERRMIGQVDTITNAAVDAMFAQDPTMVEMETTYPGIRKVLIATLNPLMMRSMQATVPLYRAEIATFYQGALTIPEAREATAFFADPITNRFYDSAADNMSYATVAKQLVAQQDATQGAIRTDLGNAAISTMRTVSPTDRQFIARFFQSPTGVKLLGLNPQKGAIDAKWMNYSPPGMEQEVERAVVKAMVDHVAKTDPDVAAAMRKQFHAEANREKSSQ